MLLSQRAPAWSNVAIPIVTDTFEFGDYLMDRRSLNKIQDTPYESPGRVPAEVISCDKIPLTAAFGWPEKRAGFTTPHRDALLRASPFYARFNEALKNSEFMQSIQ